MPDGASLHALLSQLDEPFTGELLFDQLADIVFFVKNAAGQYVAVSQTLVQRCGVRDKSQLLGRTSAEVFRPPFGENYVAQDLKVIASGRPLLDQLDTYYELACGDQGKGFRGEAALLDVEANGRALLTWLNDLFLQVAALSAHRRMAYSQAYLALAMLSDQAGRWPLARHYLWQAIRSKPRLLASPSIVRRLIKLLAGQRVRRLARSRVKGSN